MYRQMFSCELIARGSIILAVWWWYNLISCGDFNDSCHQTFCYNWDLCRWFVWRFPTTEADRGSPTASNLSSLFSSPQATPAVSSLALCWKLFLDPWTLPPRFQSSPYLKEQLLDQLLSTLVPGMFMLAKFFLLLPQFVLLHYKYSSESLIYECLNHFVCDPWLIDFKMCVRFQLWGQ